MKSIIKDEEGVTLVELIAALALLSLLLIPLGSVLSTSAKSLKIQKEQADIQRVVNTMVAQMTAISEKEQIAGAAGYINQGTNEWDKEHLLLIRHNGQEMIEVTDRLDPNFKRKKQYQVTSPDVTIHVEQEKNKNAQRQTNQLLKNQRDTFTVQETVTIRFEKRGRELYRQQVELDFRDEEKAKGKVGGDGWW